MSRNFGYQGRLVESAWVDVLSAPSREPRGTIDLALCQTPLKRGRTRAPSILWPRAVLSVSVYIFVDFSRILTVATPIRRSSRSNGGLMNMRANTRMMVKIKTRHNPKPLVMRTKAPWSVAVTSEIGGKMSDDIVATSILRPSLPVLADLGHVEFRTLREEAQITRRQERLVRT